MALSVGTDSYQTLEDGKAYAVLRGFTDLLALTDDEIERLMKLAIIELESGWRFKGEIVAESQALAWPRIDVYDNEGRLIASDAYPEQVKRAQMELAEILRTYRLAGVVTEAGVKRVKAGSVEVQFATSSEVTDQMLSRPVTRMLAGLIVHWPGKRGPRNVPLVKA